MFNLLCELHFWSHKDGIIVNNLDFGAFVYQDRKAFSNCCIYEGKKAYCDGRGIAFSLNNKRPKKLRESLAEFEEIFYENRVVQLEWKCSSVIRAVFDNGLQSFAKINLHSGDPEEFVHDRFVVGKFASNYISDVAIYSNHAVFAFTDNHVLHAFMAKPSFASSSTKKWNALDVKLRNVELAGPSGRRLDKVLSFNITGDMILMWWKCGKDEVYPWSPQVKAEDRANVHIYSLNGSKFDLVCHYRTKFDPISVTFSRIHHSTIYTIQQRVTDEGEVTLEWENANLDCRLLQNNYSLSLPLSTHVAAVALSPREDKLLATCIDGTVLVADSYGNVANRIRTNLIPSLASWHPDGALILIGNNKGQLQWFDSALASVNCQILNHDSSSSTLDVGCYFKYQPNLLSVHWNRRVNALCYDDNNDFLLLHFEKGPLVGLKLSRPHERKLSADTIVYQYLSMGAYNNALNLLHTIDWEEDSELAMSTLQSIVSFLMRLPLSSSTESALEKSLGFFLNPIRPIPDAVAAEVVDGVLDLAKKFFHLLLRYQCFEKAFRLAIDLGKRDLFMDLHYYCKDLGNHLMSAAAWERAEELLCSSSDGESASSGDYSDSSASSDSSGSTDVLLESIQDLQEKIVPPLPIMTPLECARNKVRYSSILQQHNYRRNPPNLPAASSVGVTKSSTLLSDPTKGTNNYFSQPMRVTDYLRQDSKGITLPGSIHDSSLDDSCVALHSNIPSSRAPLQFNLRVNDRTFDGYYGHPATTKDNNLCSKVLPSLNSDQHIGIPYSLKVANARRRSNEQSERTNDDYILHNPPNGRPSANEMGFIEPYSKLHQNKNSTETQHESFYNVPTRSQPEGLAYPNCIYSEIKSSNYQNVEKIKPSESFGTKQFTGRPQYVSSWDSLSRSNNQEKLKHETHSAQNNNFKSTSLVSSTPDVIDVAKKTLEQTPIVASAETEDGKIKVVHFGLV